MVAKPKIPDLSIMNVASDTTFFLQKNAQNDASGNPVYVGYSIPGTGDDEAGWFITKQTYDGNDALTEQKVASDVPGFIYVWDDRATYFA